MRASGERLQTEPFDDDRSTSCSVCMSVWGGRKHCMYCTVHLKPFPRSFRFVLFDEAIHNSFFISLRLTARLPTLRGHSIRHSGFQRNLYRSDHPNLWQAWRRPREDRPSTSTRSDVAQPARGRAAVSPQRAGVQVCDVIFFGENHGHESCPMSARRVGSG